MCVDPTFENTSLFLEIFQQTFRWWGIVGLLCIISGLLYHCGKRGCAISKEQVRRNTFFLIGGVALMVYSWLLGDPVFVVLQAAFVLASLWELLKVKRQV